METAVVTNFPPNVTPEMLRAEFWLDRAPHADAPLLTPEQIAAFNTRVYTALKIPAVLDMPETMHTTDVQKLIRQYKRPRATHYDWQGEPIHTSVYNAWINNGVIDATDTILVRFGLVTQRTDVRAFPSAEVVTKQPFEFALDRIQETTVDIGWPVAVLGTSRDGRWYWALTPHYWGWVRVEHVALALREQVAKYTAQTTPPLVTIAPQELIALPEGGITIQMGTTLPVWVTPDQDHAWGVGVPTRTPLGTLQVVEGYTTNDVTQFSDGFLPPTLRSVFTQAFKLLGERYAWGGSRMGIFGRDCSRTIRDVYATTGIQLPRNGNQQAHVCREVVAFTPEMTATARTAALVEQVLPGALLELPGHIMLYLGHVEGEPFVLHNTSAGRYHGVIVSDLSLGGDTPAGSLLARLRQAVVIGL